MRNQNVMIAPNACGGKGFAKSAFGQRCRSRAAV
jgi:hypothetical protein